MRVIAGPEKKTRVMSEKERLITAYHEMGHAIAGHFLEHSDPVHKISVISRGQALGYTISMPQEDRFLTTRAELNDTMAMTLGGRAAEEIVFGEITTGASNDIEKVTQTAKQMVMRFGMSERLGPRVFGHDHGQPFLGREFSTEPDYSDEIAREIDDEVRRIIESAHKRATSILTEHSHDLKNISEILVKRETIEKEEFLALLAGKSEEEVFGVGRAEQTRAAGAARDGRPRGARTRAAGHAAPGAGRRHDGDAWRRRRAPQARPDSRLSSDAPAPGGFRLMGVVNVTPDSFSDGGSFLETDAAVAHGLDLVRQGAEILDIGGESTRPGADPVSAEEELRRVIPVIEGLAAAMERGRLARRSRSTRRRRRSPRRRSARARAW